MNKNIIFKGTAVALLGASLLGGMALVPINPEAQAASKPIRYSSSTKKYKLCAHTYITLKTEKPVKSSGVSVGIGNSTSVGKPASSSASLGVGGTSSANSSQSYTTQPINVSITVDSKKSGYSHIHKHNYSYRILNKKYVENNNDDIYTWKNKKQYRTYITGKYLSSKKYVRDGKCYIKSMYAKKYPKFPSTSYKNKTGFQKCSECKLNKTAPNSVVTIKCPCCSQKVKITPTTMKIVKY